MPEISLAFKFFLPLTLQYRYLYLYVCAQQNTVNLQTNAYYRNNKQSIFFDCTHFPQYYLYEINCKLPSKYILFISWVVYTLTVQFKTSPWHLVTATEIHVQHQ
jgi:hypothetical protein